MMKTIPKTSIFSIKSRWQLSKNNFQDLANYQGELEFVYHLQANKIGNFKVSYTQYLSSIAEKNIWNEYLYFEFRKKFEKNKLELRLQLNNITNNQLHNTFDQLSFWETSRLYQLRPRQVLLSIQKSL